MRILLDDLTGSVPLGDELAEEDLAAAYAPPAGADSWLRVNFVSTVDGAATGADGRTGSINTAADHRVFALLRRISDAVVVGAGTLREEGYGVTDRPLIAVSRRADVPEKLRDAPTGSVLLATWAGADCLDQARSILGADQVLVTGERQMDLAAMRAQLVDRGLRRLLSEGGPHLFHSLLEAGVVDEVDLTVAPLLVAGGGPRITAGEGLEVPLAPKLLLEEDGTLLGRWFT